MDQNQVEISLLDVFSGIFHEVYGNKLGIEYTKD